MKICPQCSQSYSDDGLNFCLNDGSVLSVQSSSPEARTMVFESSRRTNEYRPEPQFQPPAVWQNQQNIQPASHGAMMPRIGNRDQSLSIISLLLGIASMVLGCFMIGIPLGIGSVITGGLAIRNENAQPDRYGGRGMAIGGIVTGAIGLAIGFIFAILIIFD